MLLSAIGCAKPEDEAAPAMQLDMVQLVETAAEESNPKSSTKAELLGDAPETYACTLVNESGNFTVHVDARVVVPQANGMPVARIQRKPFTTQDAQRIAETLLGKDANYVKENNTQTTKAFWARELQNYERSIAAGVYDDMKYASVEELYPIVEDFKAQIADAPETFATITPDFTLDAGQLDLYLRTAPKPDRLSDLMFINSDGARQVTYIRDILDESMTRSITGKLLAVDEVRLPRMSEEEALAVAEQTISDMGITGLVCVVKDHEIHLDGTGQQRKVYAFTFMRQIEDVPTTYTDFWITNRRGSNGEATASWKHELLRIQINDAGVDSLRYTNPCTVMERITDHATLLPFREIQQVFE